MLKKYAAVILFMLLLPISANAEKDVALVESMIENLTAGNSKSITMSGPHGALTIFFEKSRRSISDNAFHLSYNGIESNFKITGATLAITQDGKLVFAVNGEGVYAKAVKGCKEHLSIKYKGLEYIYHNNSMTIKHNNETYKFDEVVYHKNQNILKVYENSKHIKSIKFDH